MLEQVCEARLAELLVLGADVIPEVDMNDRELVVFVEDDVESIGKRQLLESQLR